MKNEQTNEANMLTYTIEQFCKAANIARPTAYGLIHADGFPVVRVGAKYIIPRRAAQEWLESRIGKQILGE